MGDSDELRWLDATASAGLVRDGVVAAVEVVEAAVRRAEDAHARLNAIIHPCFDEAVSAASGGRLPDGPLGGVPFVVKDLIAREAGRPFHEGSRFLKELGYRSRYDQEFVSRARRAGLVSIGRANTPEFGLRMACEPLAYGPTHNPWRVGYSPGGSSGGPAAAVAGGIVPLAHANDGGGSIRVPASMCGLVGMKPSRGRGCLGPDFGDAWLGLAEELVVSRSVRDTALALDVFGGPGVGEYTASWPAVGRYRDQVGADPGRLRIGFLADEVPVRFAPFEGIPIDPGVAAVVRATVATLSELGHDVAETAPSALGVDVGRFAHLHYAAACAWVVDLHWPRHVGRPIPDDLLEPPTAALAKRGRAVSGAALLEARELAQSWVRELLGWWQIDHFDLLVLPTVPVPTPRHGETDDLMLLAVTAPFNISGQPVVSVPMGEHDGMPVGVQLVADHGREDLLIRVAAQLETARPWAHRHPPTAP